MTIFDASRLVVGKAEGPGSGIAHLVDREVGTEGGYLSGTLVDKESHLTTLVLAQGEAAAVVGIRLIDLQAVTVDTLKHVFRHGIHVVTRALVRGIQFVRTGLGSTDDDGRQHAHFIANLA